MVVERVKVFDFIPSPNPSPEGGEFLVEEYKVWTKPIIMGGGW